MLETSARLLRLLSLLQARREWAGGELAERLEVDVRTVRRDVDRLRRLGYPVHSVSGPAGGYRLGAGACRDAVRLRFDYLSHDGSESGRLVEPHRLVTLGRGGTCWPGTSTGPAGAPSGSTASRSGPPVTASPRGRCRAATPAP